MASEQKRKTTKKHKQKPNPVILDTSGTSYKLRSKKGLSRNERLGLIIPTTATLLFSGIGVLITLEIKGETRAAFTTADITNLDTEHISVGGLFTEYYEMAALVDATRAAESQGFTPEDSMILQSSTAHYITFTSEEGGEMECIVEDAVTCEITIPE